jgi:hypothetical protein
MSGYDYFKQQHHHQRGSGGGNGGGGGGGGGGRSTNTSPIQYGGSLDYDPLELHTTTAALQQQQQHHQHLALLAMPLANYPNLFAFAPPPPLPDHHHHHQLHMPSLLGATTGGVAAGTTTNRHSHHHHHHHHQRHDSFDDLAGMVHQPQLDWSASLPVPAPVATTSSAAAAAGVIFPLSAAGAAAAASSSSSLLAASFSELCHHERWLAELQLEVKDISVDPLSGTQVLHRLREKLDDVLHKYIPCVSFLVDCQQTLRKGLERRRISAPQYYRLYVDHLPGEFCRKNIQMDGNTLTEAYNGLLQLRSEAANAQTQGSEAVKSHFLGGMKDGESWGLRKWLSRHGGALHVCTDVECIVSVCRQLDDSVLQRMSQLLRPAGRTVLHQLQTEIPTSYQAHSTAHPYLPYFHRLEAALRNLSTLGEANDIICLDSDDDDDDDVQLIVPPKKTAASHKQAPAPIRKPAAAAITAAAVVAVPQQQQHHQQLHKRSRVHAFADDDNDDNDDDVDNGSLDTKPPARKNLAEQPVFIKQDEDEEDDADNNNHVNNNNNNNNGDNDDDGSSSGESCDDAVEVIDNNPWPFQPLTDSGLVRRLVTQVYQLAEAWDANQLMRPPHVHASPFWRGNRFAEALRLFADLLDARQHATMSFLAEPTDDNACVKAGQPPFSHVVKHPIAFRCIVNSLLDRSGNLPDKSLASWNMFDGKDMLQAIDLVFLNSLAYGKMVNAETSVRQEINQLRKVLWAGIHKMKAQKNDLPTRRVETSGFIVYRDHYNPSSARPR